MPVSNAAVQQTVVTVGLTKRFGRTKALDALDMSVYAGEVHALLGPNGAGKTTAIRIILGLLRPEGGHAELLGGDPWRDAVHLHRRLAYVPGDVSLWPTLTGGEIIDLLARMRGERIDRARRSQLLERFELDPTKKARTYSKGNRQKVVLVSAFSSNAELLILDEPTSGLDPLMQSVFQDCVRSVSQGGRTILLSSHILSEVEALCHRVTIIRAGRTVETGTLDELRHLRRTTISAEIVQAPRGVEDLPGVHNTQVDGAQVRFDVDVEHLDHAMRHLSGLGIRNLTSHPPTLESLFLRHYTTRSLDGPDAPLPRSESNGPRKPRAGGGNTQ